jgi:hypothetical protein
MSFEGNTLTASSEIAVPAVWLALTRPWSRVGSSPTGGYRPLLTPPRGRNAR